MTSSPTGTCLELVVESLGGLGDGIASYGGKPVFIPKTSPGDRVSVRIIHENQNGLQGEVVQVLSPGPQRQEAPCPYFSECGSCTLQQLEVQHYRAFKTRMLHSAITQAGFNMPQAEVLFLDAATRRRVNFQVNHTPMGLALSFFALRSRRAVEVKRCLILRPELEAMIPAMNRVLNTLDFSPHISTVGLTLADNGIDLSLSLKDCSLLPVIPDDLCRELGVNRISLRLGDGKPQVVAQVAPVEMHLGSCRVALTPDAFLQATAEGQQKLTEAVLEGTAGSASVADLFCGMGTYSFPLCERAEVRAFEGDAGMIGVMQKAVKAHQVKTLQAQQRDLFKNPLSAQELQAFDAVVINPPRVGAKAQAEQLSQSGMGKVVMISCNPATFARDARILKMAGFGLESACGIDQFVWSPHLEMVGIFSR
jgi:23S rRNA (uracil1939-C5)-methyltransferase